ncbi:hypothetical protein [Bradyrhizobium sp. 192]|uniref:hypothetical protein n=1 Tax=Bradyrhizobium sp. 192 TaxID=2782660 RepID=UPI001FFF7D93|nr:hypothetical protein [Bradyrhizobium sp. 192]
MARILAISPLYSSSVIVIPVDFCEGLKKGLAQCLLISAAPRHDRQLIARESRLYLNQRARH